MLSLSDIQAGQIALTKLLASNLCNKALLTALIDEDGLLDGVTVGLFTSSLTPDETTTLADLVALAPAFTGYALSAAVVWGTPHLLSTGKTIVVGDTKQFVCSATPGSPQVITGWFLKSAAGAGPILLASARFTTPVTISETGQALPVIPIVGLGRAA